MNLNSMQAYEPNEDFIRTLNEKCGDIINIYTKTQRVLYRGINFGARMPIKEQPILLLGSRPREAEGSSSYMHKVLSTAQKRAGWNVTRDNSYFAISVVQAAKTFGRRGIVFPLDGFNFSWNVSSADTVYRSPTQLYKKVEPQYPTPNHLDELAQDASMIIHGIHQDVARVNSDEFKILMPIVSKVLNQ